MRRVLRRPRTPMFGSSPNSEAVDDVGDIHYSSYLPRESSPAHVCTAVRPWEKRASVFPSVVFQDHSEIPNAGYIRHSYYGSFSQSGSTVW